MKKIHTDFAPKALGPYSQAIVINRTLYTSGQLGIDPTTSDFASQGITGQTNQVFKNLEAVLNEANFEINEVCKVTVFLKDMGDFSVVNKIYGDFFKDHKPARSTVEVSKLPMDGLIEIELIAQKTWHKVLNLLQFLVEAITWQK